MMQTFRIMAGELVVAGAWVVIVTIVYCELVTLWKQRVQAPSGDPPPKDDCSRP